MPKWGLFVDWWDKGQRGKNQNCYKSIYLFISYSIKYPIIFKANVVESAGVEHVPQAIKSIIP